MLYSFKPAPSKKIGNWFFVYSISKIVIYTYIHRKSGNNDSGKGHKSKSCCGQNW